MQPYDTIEIQMYISWLVQVMDHHLTGTKTSLKT